ncbi:MAG: tetratricopeptide repeat protein, partial [Candidatus Acidiferrum sp.]
VALYKKAALLGDPAAQCNLGVAYIDGSGAKRNLSQGMRWLNKAAKKGDAKAQYNVGLAYLEGEGVKQNLSRARYWLRKAAGQGHSKASGVLRKLEKPRGDGAAD